MSTAFDLTGITNINEYYTSNYLANVFQEDASKTVALWSERARQARDAEEKPPREKVGEQRTPWSRLRAMARDYYALHERFLGSRFDSQTLGSICDLADRYLWALGYPEAKPQLVAVDEKSTVPVYLEMCKESGAPALWVLLAASEEKDKPLLEKHVFDGSDIRDDGIISDNQLMTETVEELARLIFFAMPEPPRFLLVIGMNQLALLDRRKWNEKRYLQFEAPEIFGRRIESTLQAMAVLLHRESLCPEGDQVLLDELEEKSQRRGAGVSQNLKYALRESIEMLGNEVLHYRRQHPETVTEELTAETLTLECLRYMYRMLFVFFIESRRDLGYAPIDEKAYRSGYSLEHLADIAAAVRDEVEEIGSGTYLFDSVQLLFKEIYDGYPASDTDLMKYSQAESLHDAFVLAPLKAHIFDPERTHVFSQVKIRNQVMQRILTLMSFTRPKRRRERPARISYANLGINQMGAVYEALLSYRGFIAETDLYEVKPKNADFNELDVGYFVPLQELDNYDEEEHVHYESGEDKGKLRMYPEGSFIYRLAGRERAESASYYTPESLTRCLVHYALEELLQEKKADEILALKVCEPAMGSAAFLNETVSQLAEKYLEKKQQELKESIPAAERSAQLQRVKMFIADRNIYGIDLNPVAVELAEVSLWLNTIYKGSFVPWFGTQLINGNSLVGARRQVYHKKHLQTRVKGARWYELAPERRPLCPPPGGRGTAAGGGGGMARAPRSEIWHFLLGDPGMASYTDKVIKSLEPEKMKTIKAWQKKFTAPYTDDEVGTLIRLSKAVDSLWQEVITMRHELEQQTRDELSIYGHEDTEKASHTTIRQKDEILTRDFRSEKMQNAGPYARLKFALDYWCALWFWPIEKADLLPTRAEFLLQMSLILVGTLDAAAGAEVKMGQQSLFVDDYEEQDLFAARYGAMVVDIPGMCQKDETLALARDIAEKHHFMHWELEFADIFADRGGFDLIIGNPPWIKMTWEEKDVLAEKNPMFAVKKLTATQTTHERIAALEDRATKLAYYEEYVAMAAQQNFMGAVANYPYLVGTVNLYKCFLPQAFMFVNEDGRSAFVHPEGVFDDPKGGALRGNILTRIRKHFVFANEGKLFPEVHHHRTFGLNVYGGPRLPAFEEIYNLYQADTIRQCYEGDEKKKVPGIKNAMGRWNTTGHPHRIIKIGKPELQLFSRLLDDSNNWQEARLPIIHAKELLDALSLLAGQQENLQILRDRDQLYTTGCWHETNSQQDGTNEFCVSFPNETSAVIYSSPHIGVANPYFQTTRRTYRVNSDYDAIDLMELPGKYIIRTKYRPACDRSTYRKRLPSTPWGVKITDEYRLGNREFVDCDSERTLVVAIMPPGAASINKVFGVSYQDKQQMVIQAGYECSLAFDFLVRSIGKRQVNYSTTMIFPLVHSCYDLEIASRALLLNCLTEYYAPLWKKCWQESICKCSWSKSDPRLPASTFTALTPDWQMSIPLRTDFARRQALVEIDVLVAQALGMTLEQLKTIYRIQFPVLQSYEADTWYDAKGRIVFTTNRSLIGVGFDRPTWEKEVKGAPAGKVFHRTITDDTQPGGPRERIIEYVAPFDRCDREQDYETAWKFFAEKYGN